MLSSASLGQAQEGVVMGLMVHPIVRTRPLRCAPGPNQTSLSMTYREGLWPNITTLLLTANTITVTRITLARSV